MTYLTYISYSQPILIIFHKKPVRVISANFFCNICPIHKACTYTVITKYIFWVRYIYSFFTAFFINKPHIRIYKSYVWMLIHILYHLFNSILFIYIVVRCPCIIFTICLFKTIIQRSWYLTVFLIMYNLNPII